MVKKRIKKPEGKILRDEEVELSGFYSHRNYPSAMRRVEARVEVNGRERVKPCGCRGYVPKLWDGRAPPHRAGRPKPTRKS